MTATLNDGTETILVGEDHEAIRDVAKANLESLGYRVFTAPDGAAALEIFARERGQIDLLLLDVVMPNLNGPDDYARMSEIKPAAPVLFITGYAAVVATHTRSTTLSARNYMPAKAKMECKPVTYEGTIPTAKIRGAGTGSH